MDDADIPEHQHTSSRPLDLVVVVADTVLLFVLEEC
jgi:hypothetical protein